jgi:thiol-disulfide isomerase/thioredoxin
LNTRPCSSIRSGRRTKPPLLRRRRIGGLLAIYASGIAMPLVLTAAIADRALGWLRRSQSLLPRLEHGTGVLLIGVGLWIAYGAWTDRQTTLEAGAPCPSAVGSQGCDLPRGAGAPGEPATIAGPHLVEFVSPNCPTCRRMAPVIARAEQQCAGLGARTVRVDVAQASGLSLARRHRIVGTPTIPLLGDDNIELLRLVGEQPLEELEKAVEHAFGLRCQGRPDFAPTKWAARATTVVRGPVEPPASVQALFSGSRSVGPAKRGLVHDAWNHRRICRQRREAQLRSGARRGPKAPKAYHQSFVLPSGPSIWFRCFHFCCCVGLIAC